MQICSFVDIWRRSTDSYLERVLLCVECQCWKYYLMEKRNELIDELILVIKYCEFASVVV